MLYVIFFYLKSNVILTPWSFNPHLKPW